MLRALAPLVASPLALGVMRMEDVAVLSRKGEADGAGSGPFFDSLLNTTEAHAHVLRRSFLGGLLNNSDARSQALSGPVLGGLLNNSEVNDVVDGIHKAGNFFDGFLHNGTLKERIEEKLETLNDTSTMVMRVKHSAYETVQNLTAAAGLAASVEAAMNKVQQAKASAAESLLPPRLEDQIETAKRVIVDMKDRAANEFVLAKQRLLGHGELGRHVITQDLCSPARDLGLSGATTVYSNLGGLGPDVTSPQSVRFANVFAESGMHVDMIVTATSSYVGTPVGKNALMADFMVINVNGGSSVKLRFSFVDRVTGDAVAVPAFLFTIAGMDMQDDGGGKQIVTLGSHTDVYTWPGGSKVIVDDRTHWNTTFTSMVAATADTKPQDTLVRARNMSPKHLEKAITVRMPHSSHFELSLTVKPGWGSRDFFFSGASNMVCSTRGSCSSFDCPRFLKLRDHSERILCKGEECNDTDVDTCCAPITPDGCKPANTLVINEHTLSHSNLAGYGPDDGAPHSIQFADVFPYSDKRLDLEITSKNTYTPSTVSPNRGLDRNSGSVNIAPGTSLDLVYRFYHHRTRNPAAPGHDFYMSFNAFDKRNGMGIDQVRIAKSYFTSKTMLNGDTVHVDTDSLNRTVFFSNLTDFTVGTPEVSVLLTSRSEYLVTISAPSGVSDQTFRFSGYSTGGCPPVQSLCAHTTCPGGYKKRSDALSRRCAHRHCSIEDMGTCCEPEEFQVCGSKSSVKFMPDALLESNLGGMGPHTNVPKHMLVTDVLPDGETRVNMRITSVTKYWVSNIPDNNLVNDFLKLEVEAGRTAHLKIEFLSQGEGTPVKVPKFYLTVADIDKGAAQTAVESVGFVGHDYVNLTDASNLIGSTLVVDGKRWSIFTATAFGDERASPFDVRQNFETGNAVGAMFTHVSSIELLLKVSPVKASNWSATRSRSFFIGGQTSLVCPVQRASCASFVCPAKQVLRHSAKSLACAGSVCDNSDADTCCHASNEDECSPARSMVISPHSLAHSNLCGLGPDNGQAKLIYGDVFPGSNRQIDLEVSGESGCNIFDPSRNGLEGTLGTINLQAGTVMNLDFRLVDARTRETLDSIWPYIVTFLNMEAPTNGTGYIEIAVSNLVSYQVTDRTTLQIDNHTFRSSGRSAPKSQDHPVHPQALMARHLAKSVALKFDKPNFNVLASVSGGFVGGHDLMFAGSSNLACPTLAFCSTLQCPFGFEHRQQANATTCLGAMCTEMDVSTCCIRTECAEERALQLRPSHVRYSNLGGYGPDFKEEPAIVYADVFPHSGQEVDLEVTTLGRYYQANTSLNGVDGPFGRISMAPGTDVTLKFRFVEPGTKIPFASVESFLFSVFNVGLPEDHRRKLINVSSYDWYALTKLTRLYTVPHAEKDFLTSGHDAEEAFLRGSPTHPLALGATQLNHSVTYMMRGHGEFNLTASVAAGWLGQTILFAGASSIVCEPQALCSSYQCPVMSERIADASRTSCKGKRCNHLDVERCCVPNMRNTSAAHAADQPLRSQWALDEDVVSAEETAKLAGGNKSGLKKWRPAAK